MGKFRGKAFAFTPPIGVTGFLYPWMIGIFISRYTLLSLPSDCTPAESHLRSTLP